jgi:ketosteroid isomerase-like protein
MVTDSCTDVDVTEIRQMSLRWAKAVGSPNVNELGELMTEDIVVVHGDGRTISGREAVTMDFAHGFERFRIEQTLVPEEKRLLPGHTLEIFPVSAKDFSGQGRQVFPTFM